MMNELPKDFITVRGTLAYSRMDTGDRYAAFLAEDEEYEKAKGGMIVGFIISAEVSQRHLDQVFGEIRDYGGVRFVIVDQALL